MKINRSSYTLNTTHWSNNIERLKFTFCLTILGHCGTLYTWGWIFKLLQIGQVAKLFWALTNHIYIILNCCKTYIIWPVKSACKMQNKVYIHCLVYQNCCYLDNLNSLNFLVSSAGRSKANLVNYTTWFVLGRSDHTRVSLPHHIVLHRESSLLLGNGQLWVCSWST